MPGRGPGLSADRPRVGVLRGASCIRPVCALLEAEEGPEADRRRELNAAAREAEPTLSGFATLEACGRTGWTPMTRRVGSTSASRHVVPAPPLGVRGPIRAGTTARSQQTAWRWGRRTNLQIANGIGPSLHLSAPVSAGLGPGMRPSPHEQHCRDGDPYREQQGQDEGHWRHDSQHR